MPKDPPAYFPTTVGAVWVYTQPEDEMKLVVTKVEKAGEGTLVSVENVLGPGKTIPIHKVPVSRVELAWTEETGETSPRPSGCSGSHIAPPTCGGPVLSALSQLRTRSPSPSRRR